MRDRLWLAFSLCCGFLLIAPLLMRPGMPAYHHDWSWPSEPYRLWSGLIGDISTWDADGFGRGNPFARLSPLDAFIALTGIFPDTSVGMKVYVSLTTLLATLGAFTLGRRVTGNVAGNVTVAAAGGAAAAIAYVVSPVLLNKIAAGHFAFWLSYALLPWILERSAAALKDGARSAYVWVALLTALSTAQPQFVVFDIIAVSVFALAHGVRSGWKLVMTVVLGAFIGEAPMLVALATAGPDALSVDVPLPLAAWVTAHSVPLPDALTLRHYVMPYAVSAGDDWWGMWIVVVLAALGMAMGVGTRMRVVAGVLVAIGLTFVTGVYGLPAHLWVWGFTHLRFLSVLRELENAAVLVALGQALAVAALAPRLPCFPQRQSHASHDHPSKAPHVSQCTSKPCLNAPDVRENAVSAFPWSRGFWETAPRRYAWMVPLAVAFGGWPFLAGGLARALPQKPVPTWVTEQASILRRAPPGKVLPIPFVMPLLFDDLSVGGVDAYKFIDERHGTASEYPTAFPLTVLADAPKPSPWWLGVTARAGVSALAERPTMRTVGEDCRGIGHCSPRDAPRVVLVPHPLPPLHFVPRVVAMPWTYDALGDATGIADYLGPLPPNGRGIPVISVPTPSTVDDDPAVSWVALARHQSLSPVPDAALDGGVITRSHVALTLNAPRSDAALLAVTDGAFTLTCGAVRRLQTKTTTPVWLRIPACRSYRLQPLTGTTVAYRLAAGAAAFLPAETYALPRVEAMRRPWPWRLEMRLTRPPGGRALLVFGERYSDRWRLRGARVIAHEVADGYANAWVLDDIGSEISLEYAPQRSFMCCAALTACAYAGMIGLLIRFTW